MFEIVIIWSQIQVRSLDSIALRGKLGLNVEGPWTVNY
jgi:hypothetical protein